MTYLKDLYGTQSKDFVEGMAEGIKLYAYWKEGEQYVGTTGKTLKKALHELKEIKGLEE